MKGCRDYELHVQFVENSTPTDRYPDMKVQGLHGISKIPRIFISLGNIGMILRYGLSTNQMCPIDALVGNRVPILFMHGQKDKLISPTHAEEMYAVTEGPKDIYFFPEGTHTHSVLTARQEYKGYVQKFLTENDILK